MGAFLRLTILAGVVLSCSLSTVKAVESNFWPFLVRKTDSVVGRDDQDNRLGPFISDTLKKDKKILSIRPFWTSFEHAQSGDLSSHVLYPVLNFKKSDNKNSANLLNLIQYYHDADQPDTFFQAFPFVFYNKTPDPDTSYFAFLPLGGTLKNRFFRDRITFAAWPLFVQTIRDDETRTHTPYPFIQRLEGPTSRGLGLWPIYGHFERDNDYDHTWALWPVFYNFKDDLDQEVPFVRFGVWPLYHRETAAGLKSETYIWPFFGYTRESQPRKMYAENRYFWPFLVQGRGEQKHVNRWLPVFAHEKSPGREKRWYAWPFLKKETFTQPGLVRDRTTLLYFLYRDEQQKFKDTTARLTTIWPISAYWDDGLGRKQLQMLDPLTVFFPRNEKVKENWSPLFAVYRFDERLGNRRHSLLWDLIVWESAEGSLNSFYAGPLFEWEKANGWSLLKGLVGRMNNNGERRFKYFWREE